MRPIDADALLDTLPIVKGDRQTSLIGVLSDIVLLVCDQPTIDAVEVVRCEDCRWVDIEENLCDRWVYCTLHMRDTGRKQYCSSGERKDGEQNAAD